MQTTLKNRSIFCKDNLDVLRGINTETVDLIYLDPPFNKNKVFTSPLGSKAEGASFRDIFRQEDVKKFQLEGLKKHHKSLADFIGSTGKLGNGYNKHYLIYMAVRLVELYRILKQTGSLYLHCDPTMSHYLKLVLDGIFGEKSFVNEIVWHYGKWMGQYKGWCKNHDLILMYSKSKEYIYHPLYVPRRNKKKYDAPVAAGQKTIVVYKEYAHEAEVQDVIQRYQKKGYKLIVSDKGGTKEHDVWTYVRDKKLNFVNSQAKERMGYPTQKPLALLERIIQASTHEGDLVLDPFCGCATTCVAAEKLNRKWIGIDVSPLAHKLVKHRLNQEVAKEKEIFKKKVFFREGNDAYVQRTDVKADKRSKDAIKRSLYGDQGGFCTLCDTHFQIQNLEVDHILARSKGGGDNYENLQLLCSRCNRIKGDRGMDESRAKLDT